MISNSAKYAIKAVIYLGLHSSKSNKILTREMFEEIQVSESYLAKILQEFRRCPVKYGPSWTIAAADFLDETF